MCKLKELDLLSIQDCLESYKVLLNWFPTTDITDADLKYDRIKIIDYLTNKCEESIEKMRLEADE